MKNFLQIITLSGMLSTSVGENFELQNQEISELIHSKNNTVQTILENQGGDFQGDDNSKEIIFSDATITTYNPVKGQTDESPCLNQSTEKALKEIYGTGNLCELQRLGIDTVAVPQDKLKHVYEVLDKEIPEGEIILEPGYKIEITGTQECDGIYTVGDALNKRFNGRETIDIFKNNAQENTKCTGAQVRLVQREHNSDEEYTRMLY